MMHVYLLFKNKYPLLWSIYVCYLEKCKKKKKSPVSIYKKRTTPNKNEIFQTKVKIKIKNWKEKMPKIENQTNNKPNQIKTNLLVLFFTGHRLDHFL